MYARMVIGEALSEDQVEEFSRIYQAEVLPGLHNEDGFEEARLMVEEPQMTDVARRCQMDALLPAAVPPAPHQGKLLGRVLCIDDHRRGA